MQIFDVIKYEGGNDADTSLGKTTPLKQNGDFRSPECIKLPITVKETWKRKYYFKQKKKHHQYWNKNF